MLDNNHETTKCLSKKIVRWQKILDLVKDFNNHDLVKDIIQNVDDIQLSEKLFGQDDELFSNPYLLIALERGCSLFDSMEYAYDNNLSSMI